MKKKYIFSALLVVVIIFSLIFGVVRADTDPVYQTIPIDFTVVIGVQDVKMYIDPECTTLVTSIHFGEVARGNTKTFTMYAKNIGDETVNLETRFYGDEGWGTAEMSPSVPITLPSSTVQEYTLSISPSIDTIPGTEVNITLEVFSQ